MIDYLIINVNFVNFTDSLPQDQDCHEMWSKQRRRKMAQAQGSSEEIEKLFATIQRHSQRIVNQNLTSDQSMNHLQSLINLKVLNKSLF